MKVVDMIQKGMIPIHAPIMPDTKVIAFNIKKKENQWESGVVTSVKTVWFHKDGGIVAEHRYSVMLDRLSDNGNYIHLHLVENDVKLPKDE